MNKISTQEFDKLFNEYQKLAHQIDKLATFIIEEIDGEPIENQGAIDTAIRLLRKQILKKPVTDKSFTNFICPTCKEFVGAGCYEKIDEKYYCENCGRRIN